MLENQTKKIPFIDWLRCCSMISIVLCHMVQVPASKVQFLAQIFNLGVQVFFLVSGFSLGLQGEITDIKKWYKRRFKKVFMPYVLFLAVLFIVYCFKPYCFKQITPTMILMVASGMQGFTSGLLGATQTWFITSILLFYAVLPLFSKMWFHIKDSKKKKIITMCFLITAFFSTYLILEKQFSVIIAPIFMCLIAYVIGIEAELSSNLKVRVIPTILLMIISFATRFLCIFIQNEKLGIVLVAASTFGIAFSVCVLFSVIFSRNRGNKLVSFLTGIGFEVYLYHNMFIEGPIYLMNKTDSLIFNIAITILAIFVLSYLANKAVVFLDSKILVKKKGIDS